MNPLRKLEFERDERTILHTLVSTEVNQYTEMRNILSKDGDVNPSAYLCMKYGAKIVQCRRVLLALEEVGKAVFLKSADFGLLQDAITVRLEILENRINRIGLDEGETCEWLTLKNLWKEKVNYNG